MNVPLLLLYINHVTLIFFDRGTSGIDIDLRRVDIDQCPQKSGNTQLNIFAASDKCKFRTTKVRFTKILPFFLNLARVINFKLSKLVTSLIVIAQRISISCFTFYELFPEDLVTTQAIYTTA
jgi:hypothetical protein